MFGEVSASPSVSDAAKEVAEENGWAHCFWIQTRGGMEKSPKPTFFEMTRSFQFGFLAV